jgi:hypothetical protein
MNTAGLISDMLDFLMREYSSYYASGASLRDASLVLRDDKLLSRSPCFPPPLLSPFEVGVFMLKLVSK